MEKTRIYGYCRISRKTQNIDRQVRNIIDAFPSAIIRKEAYTGTKVLGRKQFERIIKEVKPGDTIVFDSVSRMSRNAEEGYKIYMELYNLGINLVFLKEPTINTENYKSTVQIAKTGTDADLILEGVNKYLMVLAEKQIQIAFDQAQKEVDDLHQRTSEGMETARRAGKQIGRPAGRVEHLKDGSESKSYTSAEAIKAEIKKTWGQYDGMKDNDVMKIVGVSRGTYYKYKKEIMAEMEG